MILAVNRTAVRAASQVADLLERPAGRSRADLSRARRADHLHRPGVPMSDDRWRSPLGTRYASPAMQILWGEPHRIGLWRRLWLALAEAERELGLADSRTRRWPRCGPTSTTPTSPRPRATSAASGTT